MKNSWLNFYSGKILIEVEIFGGLIQFSQDARGEREKI